MGWLISGKGRKSKLSNFLEKNKITQQELAERSGVSKSTISRVCQGDKFSPTMKNGVCVAMEPNHAISISGQ
ncbi:helix-turn-helix transcriptional regulator [Bacillus cereus]|nr:helix-turn-helix transcriptional regulator [Bacillus cereus]MED2910424.1 helix-turn-helix transcriptional regulator [Bacillus thuringiensis]